jgi:chromate transporter
MVISENMGAMTSEQPTSNTNSRPRLVTIALLFLRLGTTAFGGPAAHIAMMQHEVVTRRQWLTDQEFLDLISASNLIPGPNSTEVAIHIGHRQAGFAGLLVAGTCFILPAMAMVMAIAWAYVQYSQFPVVSHLMTGIKPVVIAIILQAIILLSRSALKNTLAKLAAVLAVIACFLSVNEILLLLVAGAASLVWKWRGKSQGFSSRVVLIVCSIVALIGAAILLVGHASGSSTEPVACSQSRLFLYFAKVGSVLYGSGYVLIAFLQADLVQNWHWLTASQLLDATAIGQVTPGPVFTTATFIGYLLGGFPGALIATAGIFSPAFFFVAVTAPFIDKLRHSAVVRAFLDGVNIASLALMVFVTIVLGRDALTAPVAIGETLVSALILWRYKINPTWLIAAGAVIGLLAKQ